MLRSMTGFGVGSAEGISIELRSVNHRYREVKVRLPRDLAALEPRVSTMVSERVERGMIEVSVRHGDRPESSREIRVDQALADQLVEAMRDLKVRHGLSGGVTVEALTKVEGIVEVSERTISTEEIAPLVEQALVRAIGGLIAMRESEGESLAADLEQRLETVRVIVSEIGKEAAGMVEVLRDRLESRVTTLLEGKEIDPVRLEAEIAILADRSDVAEELTRLESHLDQMRSLVTGGDEPVGRKMVFLLQEIGREINTIGSKSQSIAISRLVVDAKAELERIREQVQNIE